jgi:L-alanine-DL-glutamate epimerase-like enolase superfamily enzyme
VFTNVDLVNAAVAVLAPLLKGETALEPDRVTESLHQNTFWLGRGGSVTHAISGINTALWDLYGQILGQPVGRLLGGRYRERVQPYASVLATEPAAMAGVLSPLLEQGFRAFKIGWGPIGRVDARTDENIVAAAREVIGPDVLLAVDAGGSDAYWRGDLKWALRTADMLARYDVAWFEEALDPDALEDFATLRSQARVPISGGEVLTRRQSFAPYLRAGAFDIVQPDVTKVGGLSEMRRIGWLAEAQNTKLIPHGWNTAVGLAADLQLASALGGTDLVEYKTGSAYVDGLTPAPYSLDPDGMLTIPDRPGLGIELDQDMVAKYADNTELFVP